MKRLADVHVHVHVHVHVLVLLLVLLLVPSVARSEPEREPGSEREPALDPEDPCTHATVDPIVTPVRDAALDAQRSACVRSQLEVGLGAHALVDNPGFHGVLGGNLMLGGRLVIAKAHELSAQLQLVDVAFVQNAVNKVTTTGIGPLVLGAIGTGALGSRHGSHVARAGLLVRVEIPYTRDRMATTRTSGEIAGVVTARLSPSFVLHGRLGALGTYTSSLGGTTQRLALRNGIDLVWQVRSRMALQTGADLMAGWDHGLDFVLVRAGMHWNPGGGAWRLRTGVGLPVGGAERTNAVLDLAVIHDL